MIVRKIATAIAWISAPLARVANRRQPRRNTWIPLAGASRA